MGFIIVVAIIDIYFGHVTILFDKDTHYPALGIRKLVLKKLK